MNSASTSTMAKPLQLAKNLTASARSSQCRGAEQYLNRPELKASVAMREMKTQQDAESSKAASDAVANTKHRRKLGTSVAS